MRLEINNFHLSTELSYLGGQFVPNLGQCLRNEHTGHRDLMLMRSPPFKAEGPGWSLSPLPWKLLAVHLWSHKWAESPGVFSVRCFLQGRPPSCEKSGKGLEDQSTAYMAWRDRVSGKVPPKAHTYTHTHTPSIPHGYTLLSTSVYNSETPLFKL